MSGVDELTTEAVQGMKVVQLKDALKKRGLPHSGVKRALIARLLTAIQAPAENSEPDSDEEESSQASESAAKGEMQEESVEDETSEPSQEPQDPTSDFDDMEEDVTAEQEAPTETVDNLATSDTDIAPEEPVVAEPPRDPSPEPAREPTPEPEHEEPTPVAEPEPEPVAEEPPAPTPPKPAAAPAPVPDLVVAPTPPEPAAAPTPKQAAVPDFPVEAKSVSKKRAAPEPTYEEPSYVYDEPATVHDYEEPGEDSGSQPTKKIKLSSTSTAATTLDRIQQRAHRFGIKIKQPASAAPPAGFGDSSRSSLADQIRSRAARFGTTAAIPKEVRMSARQRRFGTNGSAATSATISRSGMEDKIKSRAARFGTTVPAPKPVRQNRQPEEDDRMRSRKRRFGSNGTAVQYGNGGVDPAVAARQKRFGTTAAPGMTKPSGRRAPAGPEKGQRVIGRKASMEFEARKRRRMNKFGTEAFSDLPVGIPEENPYVKYVAEAPATLRGPSRASRLNKKSLSAHNEQARMAKRARRFGTGGDLSIKKARKAGYGGEADRMSARKRRFGMD